MKVLCTKNCTHLNHLTSRSCVTYLTNRPYPSIVGLTVIFSYVGRLFSDTYDRRYINTYWVENNPALCDLRKSNLYTVICRLHQANPIASWYDSKCVADPNTPTQFYGSTLSIFIVVFVLRFKHLSSADAFCPYPLTTETEYYGGQCLKFPCKFKCTLLPEQIFSISHPTSSQM